MNIGRLRHRVVIQTQKTHENDYGETIEEWVDSDPIWADVRHQKGDESFQAARVDATRTIKVLLRYRDNIAMTDRVKWDGNAYDIYDQDRTLKYKGELWLTCTARNT